MKLWHGTTGPCPCAESHRSADEGAGSTPIPSPHGELRGYDRGAVSAPVLMPPGEGSVERATLAGARLPAEGHRQPDPSLVSYPSERPLGESIRGQEAHVVTAHGVGDPIREPK